VSSSFCCVRSKYLLDTYMGEISHTGTPHDLNSICNSYERYEDSHELCKASLPRHNLWLLRDLA
jgi:hypothetical protein